MYGFLPFPAIVKLIPVASKYIYILTDPPARAGVLADNSHGSKKFPKLCKPILNAFVKHIHASFPNAVVVIKRGGDPFIDFARIAKSKVAICSASTFCLWPALANTAGVVHFPVTDLVAQSVQRADSGLKEIDLGPHFRWIQSPRIITRFQDDSPLEFVLSELTKE